MQSTQIGNAIEALVCKFLEGQGLRLVEKNYYCRLGEVDLVMFDDINRNLVFVEVRYRSNAFHGNPTETVDWKKQRKLKRTVLHYLQKHTDASQSARIDVVGVSSQSREEYSTECNDFYNDTSIHHVEEYQMRWTRNAITDE